MGVREEATQRPHTSGLTAGKPETGLAALGRGGFTVLIPHPHGDAEWAFGKQGLGFGKEVLAADVNSGSEWDLWPRAE